MICKECKMRLIKDKDGCWQHKDQKYFQRLEDMKSFYHSIPKEIRSKCLYEYGAVTKLNLVKMGYLQN